MRIFSTKTPKLDALQPAESLTEIGPEGPLLRDEPDEVDLRALPEAEVRNILSLEAPSMSQGPAIARIPQPKPRAQTAKSQRATRQARSRRMWGAEFREELLMQSNDINANTVSAVLTPASLLQIDAKADVMLDPAIYREVCRNLAYHPSVDLFASWEHHQVPRYYAA